MIRDRSEELVTFYTQHFTERVGKGPASANGHQSELTDEEVTSLVRGAKNAAKFEALWGGDISGYASHSEADQALISLLAFYTQDENQLDSLYRQSALCREKWLKRSDYRRSTIEKALSNLADTYTPSDDGARMVVGNGHASLPSPSPSLYKEEGRGRKLEAVKFSDMEMPGPRRYLLKAIVLAAYVTLQEITKELSRHPGDKGIQATSSHSVDALRSEFDAAMKLGGVEGRVRALGVARVCEGMGLPLEQIVEHHRSQVHHNALQDARRFESALHTIPSGKHGTRNPYAGNTRRRGPSGVGTYASTNKVMTGGRPQLFQKKSRRRPWK